MTALVSKLVYQRQYGITIHVFWSLLEFLLYTATSECGDSADVGGL